MSKLFGTLLLTVIVTCVTGNNIEEVLEAVKNGDVEEIREIINENRDNIGSFINKRDAGDGQTPLMKAVLFGQTEIVKELLKLDEVDVTIGEKDGYTPMHGAGFQVISNFTLQLNESLFSKIEIFI